MRELPSYARLFTVLCIGFALVGAGALLKAGQPGLAGILSIVGLLVQAVAGMMLAYRFAQRFKREEE